jgi:hypothetical protein
VAGVGSTFEASSLWDASRDKANKSLEHVSGEVPNGTFSTLE